MKAGSRVENTEADALTLIEVRTGEYFGENDFEWIEEDFGRG
ncbi:MAG: hypothetical protein ACMUIS_03595 [bacterium]